MKYGLALIERPSSDGLAFDEITTLFDLIAVGDSDGEKRNLFSARAETEVYPIELEAKEHECSAMGFISVEAADSLNYDYDGSGLHDYIASILDDMANEHEDNYYSFNGIDIFLSR